ncbi:alpha/beta fold hydrolase [Actinomadura madurae]|uniref:alpha/beta fold hydrolase n=1 Tax=Actinomadura madurae TaxID=1993 RepID=UPI0020D205FE|nr:alpha/beta hydrolase [Actinomadura madurae]MCQ0014069.1 alpha/beta hydrolase [Actinomadura madurae]
MDQQRIARFTHAGVADADVSVHPFATGDGLGLTLTRFHRKQSDDVVLLVHGLTTSSDMYVMPEHTNLVNYLHDAGFGDVWALDFRMSGRFPYNAETQRYNLDDIALFDHPAAMAELRRHIGDRRVHVISHCLGAVSFSMALFAGTVTGVTSLVCNSVSLTPRTPLWSRVKLAYGPALMEYVVGPCHLDPRYGAAPVLTRGWTLAKVVGPFHRDCAEPGLPHAQLHVGRRQADLHAREDVAGHARAPARPVRGVQRPLLPAHPRDGEGRPRGEVRPPLAPAREPAGRLPGGAAEVATPILFLTGDRNNVFTDSNIVCHRALERIAPGRHELAILPGYGHQDVFMGKSIDIEVLPQVLDFLKRKAG